MTVPGPAALGDGDLLFVEKIFHRIAIGVFLQRGFVDLAGITVEDNLTSQATCIRTDVYQVIGSTHDLLIVLDHHHCIAKSLQLFQHVDETVGIARVESDAGLIEDIKGTHKRASETGTEIDALALTTRECVRKTV